MHHILLNLIDYIQNIKKYKFDVVVLAVVKEDTAKEMSEFLISEGISKEKIVWSRNYLCGSGMLSCNKERFLRDWKFFEEITNEYLKADLFFSPGMFYQGFKELGLKGQRDCEKRIREYHLDEYLNVHSKVLDIGCNTGFFDLQIADKVEQVEGYDVDETMIDIGVKTKEYLGIRNVSLCCKDIFKEQLLKKYDIVFAFAIHGPVINLGGVDENEFVSKIVEVTKEGGYFFFESHNLDENKFGDVLYDRICDKLNRLGWKNCLYTEYTDDIRRAITVFRARNHS